MLGPRLSLWLGVVPLLLGAAAADALPAVASGEQDFLVVFDRPSSAAVAQVEAHGHHVVGDLSKAGVLVVRSRDRAALRSLPGVVGVAADRVRVRTPEEEMTVAEVSPAAVGGCASTSASCPLQWDLDRIHVPEAWRTTMGSSSVKVAVLDTGLTSSHEEVGPNYDRAESRSFVRPTQFCAADAATFSSPEDFQGHGTWTATHVAGVNGGVMTGIAPRSTLVNVRVLGACGLGLDSWILQGMLYAGQIGARVESMSIGGFVCADGVVPGSFYCGSATNVGDDQTIFRAYQNVIDQLSSIGTVVVAAAGNEHVGLDLAGRVISAGSLAVVSPSANPANDLRGLTEVPGGVPGVVAVGALNRVTATGGPAETRFGQYGVGSSDQLTYYSNFGPRIDISAPGGARNFNVPRFDCVSASCARLGVSAAGMSDNPGDFGAWGVNPATNAPCRNCYTFVQGTSMATPQVAGSAALTLAAHPRLSARDLVSRLKGTAQAFDDVDETPGIDDDPADPTFNFDIAYGERGVRNSAMGIGVVDAARAVA